MSEARRLLFAAFLLLLPAAPVVADSGEFRTVAIPLDTADPGAWSVGGLDYRGGLFVTSADKDFGGFSDMVGRADGRLLVASDFGLWWSVRPQHDAAGRLVGLARLAKGRMTDDEGKPITDKVLGDVEALALLSDGSVLAAFEGRNILRRYPLAGEIPDQPPQAFERPDGMARLPDNTGIEAMTELDDGRLLLLAEGEADGPKVSPGWIGRPGDWESLGFVRRYRFRPTALSRLPDGNLLLLERRYRFLMGFAVRLALISKDSVTPGVQLEPTALFEMRAPFSVDNFEALAVMPAADGGTDIYLMTDDNQHLLQRTILLQFHAPKGRLILTGSP